MREDVWEEIESELDRDPRRNLRPHAVPRRVSRIRPFDERVRVVGQVVDRSDGVLILDDGTGTIRVLSEDPSLFRSKGPGTTVRVFGTPLYAGGEPELHARIVQDLGDLDLDLHREVRREVKKFEAELKHRSGGTL